MTKRSPQPFQRHVAAVIALAALLGQAFVPHVHPLHRAPGDIAAVHPAVELASCAPECPTVASAATADPGGETHQHATSSCPLCRAQNDARSSLLPATLALPLPAAAPALPPTETYAALAIAARSLAAPRAPPFAS